MMVMIVMMILTITVIRVLTRSSDKTKSSILLSSCPAYHANLCIANLYIHCQLQLLRSHTTPVLLLYTIHRLSCFYYLLRLSGSSLSLTWTRPSNAIMTPSPLYRPSLFPFKTAINSISAIDSRTERSSAPISESTRDRDRSRLFIANPARL